MTFQRTTPYVFDTSMSVRQFARAVGVCPMVAHRYLTGARPVPTKRRTAVARILGVPVDDQLAQAEGSDGR